MNSSRNGAPHGPAKPSEDAGAQFILLAKKKLIPVLAREIPDEFFQPSREAELKSRVETMVDAWLVRDKVPIGRQLRLALLTSIFADIARISRERFGG